MIKLEISTAVALYLFFSVIGTFILWIFFEYRKHSRHEFDSQKRYIWHCMICDHTYIDSRHEDLSQCPQCKSYVERRKGEVV